jgi:F-type H+-transporting ATPase subunit b
MMKRLIILAPFIMATPAFAAKGPFFSLYNTNFVVMIAFALFVGILIYYKVPGMAASALDKRADGIRNDLEEAKALREEAQSILASYERKQREVQAQAERIVATAKAEASAAAEQAKEDLKTSIIRRLAAAEDQIASAQSAAVKAVRDQAVTIALGAAGDVIAKQMTAAEANKLIDDAIGVVETKLH